MTVLREGDVLEEVQIPHLISGPADRSGLFIAEDRTGGDVGIVRLLVEPHQRIIQVGSSTMGRANIRVGDLVGPLLLQGTSRQKAHAGGVGRAIGNCGQGLPGCCSDDAGKLVATKDVSLPSLLVLIVRQLIDKVCDQHVPAVQGRQPVLPLRVVSVLRHCSLIGEAVRKVTRPRVSDGYA